MEEKNKSENNLDFYSICCEAIGLKFDCVVGKSVSHNFPVHIHESLCIGMVIKGQRNLSLSDCSETIKPNELFVINKLQPHAIAHSEPHDYIAITIKGTGLKTVAFKNVIKSNFCAGLFLQLFHTIKENEVEKVPRAWNDLFSFLIDAYQVPSNTISTEDDFIRKSIDYIHSNYQRSISISDIANHACMSTFHFCRLFKRLTGLSPHNYLKQYRLSCSHECLQKNTPVFDTSIETGFYDSSHFIRTFQTYMAVSPKEYQESITK
jgi:AraC-like DNA-binding protein